MIVRSKEFWMVAFFFSKFGQDKGKNSTSPPKELNTEKWNFAYRMFYESLGSGRTLDSFEHSLKNARDAFDSHLQETKRIGWLAVDGKPNELNEVAASVFTALNKNSRTDVWKSINSFCDQETLNQKEVIDDLASIQNMETGNEKSSCTEGGTKVIISVRYERSLKNRNDAFKIHGYSCAVCNFNFGETYGEWGKDFAEVHHLVPISESGGIKKIINPETDLIVLCPNCHRMVHRKKGLTLTVEELRLKLKMNPAKTL
jgi:5-methylcytosine-specific restriction protein A